MEAVDALTNPICQIAISSQTTSSEAFSKTMLTSAVLLDYQVFLSDKNKGGGRVNR
jgi:hypothetical protein